MTARALVRWFLVMEVPFYQSDREFQIKKTRKGRKYATRGLKRDLNERENIDDEAAALFIHRVPVF